jgi:thymidylate kinase
LFYATDFADQLENIILPALKAGFIVLADRYIYTLMARDMVRGMDEAWLKNLYGIAPEPDAVFYLSWNRRNWCSAISPKRDAGLLGKRHGLGLSRDMFDSFLKYQTAMQGAFRRLQKPTASPSWTNVIDQQAAGQNARAINHNRGQNDFPEFTELDRPGQRKPAACSQNPARGRG